MKKQIEIGDWVNSYSKGIYRVEKIIENFYDESSPTLDGKKIGDFKDRTIISKRLLNSKLKKSIGYENCNEYFVSHLNKAQSKQLDDVLKENPKLLTELENYTIQTLTTVYNSDLQIDDENDLKTVLQLIDFINVGRTFLEIQEEMGRLDILRLKPTHFGNYTFQLFNFDEEVINRRKIWREAKLFQS